MAIDAQALHISGNYSGWVRAPRGEWEDLIGVVKVERETPEKQSIITIKSVEFGSWRGTLAKNGKSLRADTGQGKTFFQCSIRTEGQSERVRTVLDGTIRASRFNKLFDVQLIGDWRSCHAAA